MVGAGTAAATVGTRPYIRFFSDIIRLNVIGIVTLAMVRIIVVWSSSCEREESAEFEVPEELEAVKESSPSSGFGSAHTLTCLAPSKRHFRGLFSHLLERLGGSCWAMSSRDCVCIEEDLVPR